MKGSCRYPNFTADRRAMAASESVCLTGAFMSWECSARVRLLPNMLGMRVVEELEADVGQITLI